jgi:hypothetical protein
MHVPDACDVEFCPNRRVRADYGVASYCGAHECEGNNCHKLKREGGRFCPSHTCDYETCQCYAPHDGHGISQRCEHHQQCLHRGCRELLDSTSAGSGGASYFCRWHSCRQGLCGNEAQSRGGFCQDHECRERSCTRGVFAMGGSVPVFADFCDDHKCRATDCLYERQSRHYYCSRHACGIVGCDRPAARESRCQMHHHELPSQGPTPPPGYSSLGPRYYSQRRNSGVYRCYGPWD